MKRNFVLFMMFVLLLGGFSGCSKKEVVLQSPDGRFSVTAPEKWVNLDGQLNKEASLEVGYSRDLSYIVALVTPKEDLPISLEEVRDIVIEGAKEDYNTDDVGESEKTTVGGLDAYINEFSVPLTNSTQASAHIWCYTAQTQNYHVVIYAWTDNRDVKNKFKTIKKVVDSFTEISKENNNLEENTINE